jgi:hypothetical protein
MTVTGFDPPNPAIVTFAIEWVPRSETGGLRVLQLHDTLPIWDEDLIHPFDVFETPATEEQVTLLRSIIKLYFVMAGYLQPERLCDGSWWFRDLLNALKLIDEANGFPVIAPPITPPTAGPSDAGQTGRKDPRIPTGRRSNLYTILQEGGDSSPTGEAAVMLNSHTKKRNFTVQNPGSEQQGTGRKRQRGGSDIQFDKLRALRLKETEMDAAIDKLGREKMDAFNNLERAKEEAVYNFEREKNEAYRKLLLEKNDAVRKLVLEKTAHAEKADGDIAVLRHDKEVVQDEIDNQLVLLSQESRVISNNSSI